MRYPVGVVLLCFFISVAHAQQASHAQQAPFEPYTITEKEHQALLTFLGEVPAKYANPIINALLQSELAAQKKKAEASKPPDKAK